MTTHARCRYGADTDTERDGGEWWCALPDVEAAEFPATVLRATGRVLASHQSGRPWIMGRYRPATVRLLVRGTRRAALLGDCLAPDEHLAAAIDHGIDRLARLPGSFHALLARPAGQVATGDVAGFRRLFTARVHGVPVLASHAVVLRQLVDAPVDRVWLACRLASPEAPSVLRDTLSPFTGISPVPAGHRIEITGTRYCMARWWTPPAADLPLAAGAAVVRTALTTAVTGRVSRADGLVSVQLSGGLDSTALAALAHPARPLLITTAGRSPVDDDLVWARRAAELLPGCPHRVIAADEAPLFFSGLDAPGPGVDEPAPFAAGVARQRYTAGLLAEHGSACHLNGQGGDEVLLAPLSYLRAALRTVPRIGWRHLRGHAALKDMRVPALVRAVARRESFAAWLRRSATTLRTEPPTADRVTGWEAPPVLPPWATPDAADLVASTIRAAHPIPIGEDQTTHAALVRIRASAYRAGLYRDAMAAASVPTAMPFFDRAVVEACLSVLPWERTDPWQPKPLLRAALADLAPETLLCRRTKGGYNADIHHGWSAHRDQLADLLARPRLAEHGLIDTTRMHRGLASFGSAGLPPAWVTDLIAIEVWLRDLDRDLAPPLPHRRHDTMEVSRPAAPTTSAPVRLTATVQATPVGDGMALLDLQRGTLYHVNRTGAVILTALTTAVLSTAVGDASASAEAAIQAAADAVAARYGIPVEQARADVAALLEKLRDRGLLEQDDGTP